MDNIVLASTKMATRKKNLCAAAGQAAARMSAGELNFAPRSQQELRALASMVVASLPFPPLPVMVLWGEDATDGLASSFDLLQTAVMNSHLRPPSSWSEQQQLARSKQATLEKLQRDMAALYAQTAGATDPDVDEHIFLSGAYELYCAAFRSYLLEHYPASTRDLRFYPLAAVAPDSQLMSQGSSHWNASRLSLVCDTCGGDHFGCYKQLVRAYAVDLATLAE
jgi:hypothetical protein